MGNSSFKQTIKEYYLAAKSLLKKAFKPDPRQATIHELLSNKNTYESLKQIVTSAESIIKSLDDIAANGKNPNLEAEELKNNLEFILIIISQTVLQLKEISGNNDEVKTLAVRLNALLRTYEVKSSQWDIEISVNKDKRYFVNDEGRLTAK